MWEVDDVVRSTRRYLTLLLAEFPGPADDANPTGRAWEIRLTRELVTDQQRPLGVLESLVQNPGRGRTSIPQGTVVESMAMVFTGYPPLVAGDRAVIEGDLRAKRLASALDDLIRYGLDTVKFSNGRRAAGPQRLPLWDYTAVAVAGQAGPATPHDVLNVESWTTRSLQDPLDEKRFTVVLNVNVSWERPGRVNAPAPIAASMPGTFQSAP